MIYLATDEIMDLSRAGLITQAKATLDAYTAAVTSTAETVKTARQAAIAGLKSIEMEWSTQTQAVHDALEAVLRALQREGIDGDEYLKLRREHDKLAPLTEQLVAKESNLARVLDERAKMLVEADDRRAARLRELKKEARKVSRNLAGT